MLAKHPIDVMLTAIDLGAAKQFYGDGIGLEVLIVSNKCVTFECGGDSRLVVTRTSSSSSDEQTRATPTQHSRAGSSDGRINTAASMATSIAT
jgi:catechol-2,3-dioxygenase